MKSLDLWREHAIKREGLRKKVYKDSLGKLTVGIGHLVLPEDNLRLGDEISKERIEELFQKDTLPAYRAACKQAKEIGCETPEFICALISVNFQLGTGWPQVFKTSYPALVNKEYEKAITGFERSVWARQTPVRVEDFVNAIKNIRKETEQQRRKTWSSLVKYLFG